MAEVIRSAPLGDQPRRLATRTALRPAVPAASPPPKPPAAPAEPVRPDPAVERERERRAQADHEAAVKKAVEDGYEAGHAKGLEEAHASLRDKQLQLERLLHEASQAFAGQLDALEDVAVGIAFAAAVKILGESLATPAGVRAAVRQVLERTRTDEKLVVRLAPHDFYLLLQQRADAWPAELELVPDERIELGGCLVETSAGTLDARIETQMAELRRVLTEVREQARQARGGP